MKMTFVVLRKGKTMTKKELEELRENMRKQMTKEEIERVRKLKKEMNNVGEVKK